MFKLKLVGYLIYIYKIIYICIYDYDYIYVQFWLMFGLKNQYFLKYGYSLYYVRTIPQLERIVTDYQHVRTLSKFMVELSVCLDVFVVCLD